MLAPAAAVAADDPAPLPRPDALVQPVSDGCQRNPAGLLTFTSPEWVFVHAHNPNNSDPRKARVAEGVVTRSDTATGDLPQNHAFFDFNTDVFPDPGSDYLLGGDPDAQNGNFADAPPILHAEWESGTLPPYAWPSAGDRVKLWGSWVWDCGHWGQGFTSDPNDPEGTIINDTDYFLPGTNQTGGLRGEQTEFHPMQAVVATRDKPNLSEVRETQTDVFISSRGTTARSESVCSLEHPPPTPFAYGPDWTLCINNAAKTRQPANDRDYTFFVPAPPRPAAGVPLRVRVVDHDPAGTGPQEQIVPRSDGIEVTVPYKDFGGANEDLGYGKSFFVGWDGPLQDRNAHVQVKLKQVKINNSLDDPEFGTSLGVPPGEWGMYSNINGHWQFLNELAPDLDLVFTGDVVNINHTFDVRVPAGKPLRLEVTSRECDLPRIQPCPITSEVAEDNDSPGSAEATFPNLSLAVGEHTLMPPVQNPRWELTYEVIPVSPASQGPPLGPGCFDSFSPSSTAKATRRRGRLKRLTGSAIDHGCPGGSAGIRRVEVSVLRSAKRGRCRHLKSSGRLSRPASCSDALFLPASGGETWSLPAARKLPPGRYIARARATDFSGNLELSIGDESQTRFRIRRR